MKKYSRLVNKRDRNKQMRLPDPASTLAAIPNEAKFICEADVTQYSNGVKAVTPKVYILPAKLHPDRTVRRGRPSFNWGLVKTSWYLYQRWDAIPPAQNLQVDVSVGAGYSRTDSATTTTSGEERGVSISVAVEVTPESHAQTSRSHPSWIWSCVCDRTGEP